MVQDLIYNRMLDHNKYKPCEMYFEDSEESRFVTQEECDKLNKEDYEDYLKRKDNFEVLDIEEDYSGSLVYGLPMCKIDTYVDNLSESIMKLSEELKLQSVFFLLDYSTPWLYQNNDFKPVKKALEYLRNIGITDSFCGGIKASGQEIKELTKNLFWILRCNASLPDCYFSGIDKDFIGDICKHGNIHFHCYSKKEKLKIKKTVLKIGMRKIENGKCYELFSKSSAIKGRQIIV